LVCSSLTTGCFGPVGDQFISIYERLLSAFGPQAWWPGDSPFEVCAGAILTQNTNWKNARKAVANLKNKDLLRPRAIYELSEESLALIIRSAGYYNVKAGRLKNFVAFLVDEFGGNLDAMFSKSLETLRPMLLDIKGIGPETADTILLYAGELPSFVVDVYTIRALMRHDFIDGNADYEGVRSLLMDHLPADVELYNEYHALWVVLGKTFCKKTKPRCEECPLNGI
jgi:endonuclease III related protein